MTLSAFCCGAVTSSGKRFAPPELSEPLGPPPTGRDGLDRPAHRDRGSTAGHPITCQALRSTRSANAARQLSGAARRLIATVAVRSYGLAVLLPLPSGPVRPWPVLGVVTGGPAGGSVDGVELVSEGTVVPGGERRPLVVVEQLVKAMPPIARAVHRATAPTRRIRRSKSKGHRTASRRITLGRSEGPCGCPGAGGLCRGLPRPPAG